LKIDATYDEGSSYVYESDEFTFHISGGSNCDQYSYLPVVKGFGLMFELEGNQHVQINLE
jgi:predicted nuclease of restriction endonuclease-like RecB superfamily